MNSFRLLIALGMLAWALIDLGATAEGSGNNNSSYRDDQSTIHIPNNVDDEVYVESQCFRVRGVPTLRLQCSPTASGELRLIYVRQAFYGVPPPDIASNRSSLCVYDATENHCTQLADLPPGHRCNGRQQCFVHVSNPYLMNCRQYAVYMQVNYTCVPRSMVFDVCSKTDRTVLGGIGYVRSPSYPEMPSIYSAVSQLCRCRLSSSATNTIGDEALLERDSSAAVGVVARILDLALTTTVGTSPKTDGADDDSDEEREERECRLNYLNITGLVRRCPTHATTFNELPEMVNGGGNEELVIEFRFDTSARTYGGRRQILDRGFWLQFASLDGSDVTATCDTVWSIQPIDTNNEELDIDDERHFRSHGGHPSTERASPIISRHAIGYDQQEPDIFFKHNYIDDGLNDLTLSAGRTHFVPRPDIVHEDVGAETPNISNIAAAVDVVPDHLSVGSSMMSSIQHERRYHDDVVDDGGGSFEHSRRSVLPDYDLPLFHSRPPSLELPKPIKQGSSSSSSSNSGWPNSVMNETQDKKSSSAAIVGELFENHDFSRARESLKYNIDEVQIVTGIIIGILSLVAICIIIILVFRRR